VSRRIGDYAESKYKEAAAAGDQAGMDAWKEGGAARAEMQMAGAALVTGLAGGNALGGAAGAAIASLAAGKLNEISSAVAGAQPTSNADANEALGNIVANAIATGTGGAVGGNAGAFSSYNVDRYNRQLHPDERQWAKDNASKFAQFYHDQTGKDITSDQAQQMLLANGYRMVDAVASKGPGGDVTAAQFISQNAGKMFRATSAEYNSPFIYGNKDGSLTSEQKALPGSTANPAAGLAIAGGLVTAGLGPEIVSGAATAVSYGKDLLAAYKAAQAGYSLTTAAATGATASGTLYTGGAAGGAYMDYRKNGADYMDSFDQRFSYVGLATAATFGAYSNMFATSMFNWAGIPNSIQNVTTVPGIVIRGTNLAIGQTVGKAAQAAVKSSESKKN
jgi:filamentous hemagglutinin